MNTWLICILCLIAFGYILESISSFLNLSRLSPTVPDEFKEVFDQDEYKKSQSYTRITTKFSFVQSTISTLATTIFLLLGGFNSIDTIARNLNFGPLITGVIFIGLLLTLSLLMNMPFSLFSTFVIEQRFGFNRTTAATFCLDMVKGILLAIVVGTPLLLMLLWFFQTGGSYAWLYCWIGVIVFSLFMQFFAPVLIMPLFNKFIPLEDGELKQAIVSYAELEDFKIQGIFTMDGSKRSSKLNAFFTGFGKFKKIVFFDTLIAKLTNDEIIAVLAHEMGHFKLKHIPKMIIISFMQTGLMFFLLSLFLENKALFSAFQMNHLSIYASMVFFGFLYSPINLLTSILNNILSRRHEFQADNYAANSAHCSQHLIDGLKKLSLCNLSNLTPHPFHVFLHYSHPPVLIRIKKLLQL